ncbi:hypothetical protein RSAG8_10676, partial [Rhizoctonia solani AG-8 WAC10335]
MTLTPEPTALISIPRYVLRLQFHTTPINCILFLVKVQRLPATTTAKVPTKTAPVGNKPNVAKSTSIKLIPQLTATKTVPTKLIAAQTNEPPLQVLPRYIPYH